MSTQQSLFEEYFRSERPPEEQALYALVESVDWDACGVSVAFASQPKKDQPALLRELEMSQDLQAEFRRIVESTFTAVRTGLDKREVEVRQYRSGTRLADHQIELLQVGKQTRVVEQLALFQETRGTFDGDPQFSKHLRFYAITVHLPNGGADIHCFRVFSEASALGHKRRAIFLGGASSHQYQLLQDPGYLIDDHIDCICRGNELFILKKDKFQYIFQFYELIHRDVRTVLRSIERRLPIANIDVFLKACDDEARMACKVAEFRGQPHLRRLSIARAHRSIDRFKLPIRTTFKAGQECLEYHRDYKWEFLRLLGDEYLSSPMTRLDYEADGKRLAKHQRHPLRNRSSLKLVPQPA